MREFAQKKINLTVVKVNEDCNLMLTVMENSYKAASVLTGAKFSITDLAKVC
jgi:hypothetical protein